MVCDPPHPPSDATNHRDEEGGGGDDDDEDDGRAKMIERGEHARLGGMQGGGSNDGRAQSPRPAANHHPNLWQTRSLPPTPQEGEWMDGGV